jgi:hypothetical protein
MTHRSNEWRSPFSYDRQGSVPRHRRSGRYQETGEASYAERDWRERGRTSGYSRGLDYGRRDFGQRESFGRDPRSGAYGERNLAGEYEEYYEEDFDELDQGEPDYWVYEEIWYVPGPYVGLGPRNYQRSDERLLDQVCERICMHGELDASDLSIEVQDGEVYLTGTVQDRYEKRLAEDIAESVPGVHDVHNRLRVQASNRLRDEPGSLGQFYSSDMGEGRGRIMMGMQAFGSDGEYAGEVKELRGADFLLDRPMARDVYVPYEASQVRSGQIHLNVPAGEVDNQDWPQPALFGPGEEAS